MLTLTLRDFQAARTRIAAHIKHTPLMTSRQLSELKRDSDSRKKETRFKA